MNLFATGERLEYRLDIGHVSYVLGESFAKSRFHALSYFRNESLSINTTSSSFSVLFARYEECELFYVNSLGLKVDGMFFYSRCCRRHT